jgi:hypothetical protein
MAALEMGRIDVERIAETQQDVHSLRLQMMTVEQRLDRQDSRVNSAFLIAVIAAVGGTLFGIINFVLLLQLFARLG